MKTEFLKGFGLEQDVVDKIMAENGKDIAAEKAKTAKAESERDNFKDQLATATESLEKFKDVDPAAMQGEIDKLLARQENTGSQAAGLTKGLNETTLGLIRGFLKDNRDVQYSSEQIAEQIHLSRITIRRYMNYMLETGELISTIDYQTGGRPSIRYRYINK